MDDAKQYVEVKRILPSAGANDTANTPMRGNEYGELLVQPVGKAGAYALAAEGSYFVAQNATALTAIAGHPAPVLADFYTKSFIYMRMADNSLKRVYLDFISLQVTATGAGAADATWAAEVDTGNSRLTSGGTALTPVNSNMDSLNASGLAINVGANVTVAASASQRKLGAGRLRTVIPVVGDTYLWDFGAADKRPGGGVLEGALQAMVYVPMPPVIIGSSDMFLLHLAGVTQSGASSYLVRMGYWER